MKVWQPPGKGARPGGLPRHCRTAAPSAEGWSGRPGRWRTMTTGTGCDRCSDIHLATLPSLRGSGPTCPAAPPSRSSSDGRSQILLAFSGSPNRVGS